MTTKEKESVSQLGRAAARDLRALLQSEVSLPGEPAYERARQIVNGAVNHWPALFVFCERSKDVQEAVRIARSYRLPLSVRGGGHDWAGRALRDQGLVIDLSRMRRVAVDLEANVATVEGGATAGDLASACTPYGLVAVTGAAASVGVVGLTLGGGYGPLSPKYGLAVDNLVGAQVVLADGSLVTADAEENADLFWALRGGGGNFGVVTSIRVRLHPLQKILTGFIVFPGSQAEPALRGYSDLVTSTPDELATIPLLCQGPDGALSMMITAMWCGELAQGERVMAQLQRLGTPGLAHVNLKTCTEVLDMFESFIVSGRHYTVETRSLPALTPDAVAALITAMENRTSPFSALVWHHCHGAPTRIPIGETPFAARQEHFMIDIVAGWEADSRGDKTLHREWARKVSQALAPMALPGGYPNMMGPEAHDQIPYAYGSNLQRLQSLKKRFDPDGIFTSAIPLPQGQA